MFNRKKIRELESRVKELETKDKLLMKEFSDIIKDKFAEVSNAFDKMIVNEADDLRKEWKLFESNNKKFFKYKKK
ncbi:MAG: hypothetical protein EOL97_15270 [Spirochaetia bacterium]|nr:hypothetical protein [Spirochaetia bacterium]